MKAYDWPRVRANEREPHLAFCYCGACGQTIDRVVRKCPFCGRPLRGTRSQASVARLLRRERSKG